MRRQVNYFKCNIILVHISVLFALKEPHKPLTQSDCPSLTTSKCSRHFSRRLILRYFYMYILFVLLITYHLYPKIGVPIFFLIMHIMQIECHVDIWALFGTIHPPQLAHFSNRRIRRTGHPRLFYLKAWNIIATLTTTLSLRLLRFHFTIDF